METRNSARITIAFWVFALVAGFFLVAEHQAHLLGFYAAHEVHILRALPVSAPSALPPHAPVHARRGTWRS